MASSRKGSGTSILKLASILGLMGAAAFLTWWWWPVGTLARGRAAYEAGNWKEAAELAHESLKTSRDDPEALRLRARSLARLGRNETALSLYRRLEPKTFSTEDHFLQGLAQLHSGQPDRAQQSWSQALAIDPNHAESLESLARLYTKSKRLDEALASAEKLSRLPGWEVRGSIMEGVLRVELNDPQGAAAALSHAFREGSQVDETTSTPDHFRKLYARTLLQVGKADEASAQLKTVLERGPDEEASWLLSRALLTQGKLDEAKSVQSQGKSYRTQHPIEPEPSPYVGEQACVPCHRSICEAAAGSRHSQTLFHGEGLLKLPRPSEPLPDPGDPQVTHTITRHEDRIEATAHKGEVVHKAVVEYAFGTPDRYVTMVGRDKDGTYRALRLSSYAGAKGTDWDLSAGDEVHPRRTPSYLGRPMEVRAGVVRCLFCHSTNPRTGQSRTGPENTDQAIGCERCHGPGETHIRAVHAKFPDLAIVNPGHASTREITASCAECHNLNPPEVEASTPREDPRWARSPGITLTWSRCYTESGGSLTCLNCHNPHQGVDRSPKTYEKACLSCHSGTSSVTKTSTCPVNPTSGCLSCHMPAVPSASLHTQLTDHYIRIRRSPETHGPQARESSVAP